MDTFEQMIDAVQSDLTVGDESTFLDLSTVKLAINRAYRKIGALFRWKALSDAKTTSTVNGQEYYNYPDGWRDDSIWRLEVDDEMMGEEPDGSALKFEDYLAWKREFPDSTDKKWANYGRKYFFKPIPTSNGSGNISVWGQMNVTTLVNNADETIFSGSMPEVNEAIVMEAKEILKGKGDVKNSDLTMISPAALQQVTISWNKTQQEQAKQEKNQPFWNVPDLFGRNRGRRTGTGDFN